MSLGFGVLLLLILIVGGQSVVQFRDLGQSTDVILRENYRSIVACQEMKEAIERLDSAILFIFLGYSREGRDLVNKYDPAFTRALQIELSNITIPGEREKAAALEALFKQYRAIFRELQKQKPARSVRLRYFRELLPLSQQIKQTADDILRMNQAHMNVVNELARRQAASARQRLYLLLFYGIAVASLFMFFIGKWILRPIDRLVRYTEEIRDGNLDLVVQKDSNDEIGRLSEAFNDMVAGLRKSRRRTQAKLLLTQRATKETFSNLPDAVAIVDPDGKIEFATDSADKVFLLHPGTPIQDVPDKVFQELFRERAEYGATRESGKNGKIFQKFINMEERFFQPGATSITDHDGNLAGVVFIMQDVTQERHLEEMKSGLISTVSHQLKTPLTSLRMAIHLLLDEKAGDLTEKQVELLMTAREESERLHRILANLLDISQIESGRLPMACVDAYPHTLVMEALEPFRRAAQDSGIELKTELPDDLPMVCADSLQMGHVFANLLSNALRYTAPGGAITVAAVTEENMVRFSVSDTGSGIPHQFLQRIFEHFFRVPDQKTETGAGLGLAIAKEIVEAHGGSIYVESEEGKGTTFTFTLRRADRLSGGT